MSVLVYHPLPYHDVPCTLSPRQYIDDQHCMYALDSYTIDKRRCQCDPSRNIIINPFAFPQGVDSCGELVNLWVT